MEQNFVSIFTVFDSLESGVTLFVKKFFDWWRAGGPFGFLVVFLVTIFFIVAFLGAYFYILKQQELSKNSTWVKKYVGRGVLSKKGLYLQRWDYVLTMFESNDRSDWKEAIIESSAILEEVFISLGYENTSQAISRLNEKNFLGINYILQAFTVGQRTKSSLSEFDMTKKQVLLVKGWFEKSFKLLGLFK